MRLLKEDYNEVSGLTTQYLLRDDDKITVRVLQDVDPIFKANKETLNSVSSKGSRDYGEGIGVKVASIPNGLVEEVNQTEGLNLITCSTKELKAFVNDSKYNKIRTAHGMI
jgi:hypothetical protein